METVGIEPTVFLMSLIYSQLPSPLGTHLHNTLFPMCVLKHSKLLRLPVRKECFNTLWFFTLQIVFHPTGRPFTTVYRVLRGPRFPYHVAVLAGIWPTFLLANSSMILCHTFHLVLDQLFKLFLSKSVLHCPFCFFNLFLYHCSLKQKTPGCLILGSLKVKM